MKSILSIPTPVAILLLLAALNTASAQTPFARGPNVDPVTGIPAAPTPLITSEHPRPAMPFQPTTPPNLDPATGLPLPPVAPQWIDPNWPDPGTVLTNVSYDGLPLSEVARGLRDRFADHFDILPMPATFGQDWGGTTIQLQLKNVRASEVFNAMNLVFENDGTPLRWELKVHSSGRPLALLRVLPEAAPTPTPYNQAETHRMVYFIGNLVGDEKSGGLTMDQIVKTITDVWPAEFGKPDGVIQFHKDAQLLVANGTPDQLEFIRQTLAALAQKVELARPKSAEAKAIEEQVQMLKNLKNIGDSSK